jgi:hypothetical protein
LHFLFFLLLARRAFTADLLWTGIDGRRRGWHSHHSGRNPVRLALKWVVDRPENELGLDEQPSASRQWAPPGCGRQSLRGRIGLVHLR